MRVGAAAHGFSEVVAPVRLSAKHHEPHTPLGEYAARTRDDGLPHDPWLRVHVRAGGVIDCVAPASMVILGTLAEWREWTGLPFVAAGWVEVPGALSPVRCPARTTPCMWSPMSGSGTTSADRACGAAPVEPRQG
jgi:hypothetical protein